jgi:cytoskeletal protein CcmA (bactofilin family)
MGWFDNEEGGDTGNAPVAGATQHSTVKANAPSPSASGAGSTLGRHVQVDGTIVCGEDLTILGKVEGTIRAKGTLVIAEKAEVKATIDGQRVLVHGRVAGDVHGDEKVTLGPTAHLTGNIEVSSLEILEGAYLKGNVEMKAAKEVKAKAPTGAGSKTTVETASQGAPVAKGDAAKEKQDAAAAIQAKQDSKSAAAKPSGGPGSS